MLREPITVGFIKLEEEKSIRTYAVDPRQDKTITIPPGAYEVIQYGTEKNEDYYVKYVTSEGEQHNVSYYNYEMDNFNGGTFYKIK